ncbi:putative amidase, partial [Lachnellula suecica]
KHLIPELPTLPHLPLVVSRRDMDTAKLVAQARETRDSSLARIEPPLGKIPSPRSKNVTKIANDLLTARELEITALDAPEILTAIREKTYSCVDVTRAFLRRAALAQELTNCITELLPERAIERAKYLDSLQSPAGPLHGLPISIKEHQGMRGCTTNGGYVAFIGKEVDSDIDVNDTLWEAGAVFYARTTQPQAVMHLETSTSIYGVTTNPWNIDLTAGGTNTWKNLKNWKYEWLLGIMPTKGPITSSRSGLDLFMETYFSYEPWIKDDSLVPLPWRSVSLPSKLKIAVMWSDDIVTPHPPVTRALKEIANILNQAGHEIVDWKPEGHDECWDITQALYWEDGGKNVEELILKGGEELLHLTKWLIKDSKNVKFRTAEEVCALKIKRNAYRARYNRLWLSTGSTGSRPVDAILCPTGPGAAPPHENAKYWNYTSQWNLLEYPGAVFPVTFVDQKLDVKDASYVPKNEQDKFNYELYDPAKYTDAPIGLQIVTRRFEDEKCLKVLEVVEKAMGRK